MPIHDQGYRRYGGRRVPRGRAWLIIARTGVRTLIGRRAFIALLLVSWVPFVVRAVQLYAAAYLPQAAFLAPTPETFRQFLSQQEVFLFFITVYAGAGLIANDRRANALQIYLSKPLTRAEYICGKLTILFAFLLFVTWVPAVLLLVVQILFAGNFTFLWNNLYLFPAITLFSFIQALTVALAMLALSSLSRSSRYVGILYAALLFFTQAIYGVLRAVTGSSQLSWLSVPNSLDQLGNVIFKLPGRYDTPVALSALTVIAVLAASGIILERRVRGLEVVA
jgi:ABC-2 type transport system permease protein